VPKLPARGADRGHSVKPPATVRGISIAGSDNRKGSDLLNQAKTQSAADDLPKAHETLEGIREALGSLHARNHVETFPTA
jgi:hypothetical protein